MVPINPGANLRSHMPEAISWAEVVAQAFSSINTAFDNNDDADSIEKLLTDLEENMGHASKEHAWVVTHLRELLEEARGTRHDRVLLDIEGAVELGYRYVGSIRTAGKCIEERAPMKDTRRHLALAKASLDALAVNFAEILEGVADAAP